MPQGSVAYAVARVHVQERDALEAGRIDRLLSAATYPEALRMLAEIGWAGADSGTDAESIATDHVRAVCALVRTISPCPMATDSFLLRYDGLNLKILLKARCLGQSASHLSDCGVFPVDVMTHCVADHAYKKLPDALRVPLEELEKTLAVREDALEIDTTVDKAVFSLILQNMRAVKSPVVRGYFTARADMLNAIMQLRARRMGRDWAFVQSMLLPGGQITPGQVAAAYEKPEQIPGLLERYGRSVKNAATLAVQDLAKLPALEKAMDDALLRPFSGLKHSALRIEPVIGFILGAEREAAAVRLILAGKANGFSPEAIRERLRDLYGQ